jgi:hypothetical protein
MSRSAWLGVPKRAQQKSADEQAEAARSAGLSLKSCSVLLLDELLTVATHPQAARSPAYTTLKGIRIGQATQHAQMAS